MAETYTDSTGKVFPVNQFGRPMGYFDGNTFVFPRFGNQPAVTPPSVNPVTPNPVVQPMAQPGMIPQNQDDAGAEPTQLGNKQNAAVASVTTEPSFNVLGNPAVMQGVGSRLGGLLGPAGAVGGSILGGLAGGRGTRGIAGDVIGTGLGTALLGPLGFLGGIAGGRIGDMKDMESALGFQDRGQRGFFDSLGYGIGLSPSLNQQMSDYYGINQAGIDPFGAGLPAGTMTAPIGGGAVAFDEDDIGDIDPGLSPFSDPFGDIADAFGGGTGGFDDDDTFGGMAAEE